MLNKIIAEVCKLLKIPSKGQDEVNLYELLSDKASDSIIPVIQDIVDNYDKNKKSILIIDDSVLILSLVEEYLLNCNITSETFNILKFSGTNAPFIMEKTLFELESKGLKTVDYALIDIVLPGKISRNGLYHKMDGIDVSILLNNVYNCKSFLFFSGNALNLYVDYIQEKINKFKKFFNKNLNDYIILKTKSDDEINKSICNMISKSIPIN